MNKACLGALLGLALSGLAAAQERDFSKVEVKATQVAGNVYMLEGAGGNIGVSVGSDGIAHRRRPVRAARRQDPRRAQGAGRRQARASSSTPTGTAITRAATQPSARDATIVAHDNVRKRLATRADACAARRCRPRRRRPCRSSPSATRCRVHFNGEEIQVAPLPARPHRRRQRHLLHRLERGPHGRRLLRRPLPVRRPGERRQRAPGYIDNVERILAGLADDVKIIPGHGPLSTESTTCRTTSPCSRRPPASCAGASQPARAWRRSSRRGCPRSGQEWGSGFIKTADWIGLVHASLSEAPETGAGGATHHH